MDDEIYKILGAGGIGAIAIAFAVRWLSHSIKQYNNAAANMRGDVRAIEAQEVLNDNLMAQIESLQTRLDAANAETQKWREKYYDGLKKQNQQLEP